jgi:hypothetical protein
VGQRMQSALGIPPQHDRAQQTLVRQALAPAWDAQLSPHTSGFRPGRAGWDAIAAICHGITFRPQYALKVDIAKGVDRLCHDALLVKTPAAPVIRRQLNAWRKAGIMEENRLFPTTAGTPQGGSISPVLALIALHGMDEAITHGNGYAPFWSSGRRSDPCATRRVLCTVMKHLSPVRGRQAYPPSLEAEQPPGEGSPGETMGSTGGVAHP